MPSSGSRYEAIWIKIDIFFCKFFYFVSLHTHTVCFVFEKFGMGRYAFFSTGFEYKFWFGLQNSLDILNFGGTSRNSRGEDGAIEWTFHFDYD